MENYNGYQSDAICLDQNESKSRSVASEICLWRNILLYVANNRSESETRKSRAL